MSFLSVDGKIMKCESGFPKRKVNSLTFQMEGDTFPMEPIQDPEVNGFFFRSNVAQNMTVNYGDGVVISYPMLQDGSDYLRGWARGSGSTLVPPAYEIPHHDYQDGNTGLRNITISFEDLSAINEIQIRYILAWERLPKDLLYITDLETLMINTTLYLTEFPEFLGSLQNLRQLILSNEISQTVFDKIPDSFFDLNLTFFSGKGVFDLSDLISSNLFKVNQWGNIETLDLTSCNITELDSTLGNLTTLTNLYLDGNELTEMPTFLENLVNLRYFRYGVDGSLVDVSFIDFTGFDNLNIIALDGDYNLSEIPTKWAGLIGLNNINYFNLFVDSDTQFDEFINEFYTLCTTNGSITNNSGQFATYPNRFRNISWGYGSLSFTGAKVAPSGYVQGVSNGTPANQGEKVYVLQNQYGHVIDHA